MQSLRPASPSATIQGLSQARVALLLFACRECAFAAADMVLEVDGKVYPVLMQYRQAVQYSSTKKQHEPVDRFFTAQAYALQHNALMLMCQGGLGVYVATGQQVADAGVAAGANPQEGAGCWAGASSCAWLRPLVTVTRSFGQQAHAFVWGKGSVCVACAAMVSC